MFLRYLHAYREEGVVQQWHRCITGLSTCTATGPAAHCRPGRAVPWASCTLGGRLDALSGTAECCWAFLSDRRTDMHRAWRGACRTRRARWRPAVVSPARALTRLTRRSARLGSARYHSWTGSGRGAPPATRSSSWDSRRASRAARRPPATPAGEPREAGSAGEVSRRSVGRSSAGRLGPLESSAGRPRA